MTGTNVPNSWGFPIRRGVKLSQLDSSLAALELPI